MLLCMSYIHVSTSSAFDFRLARVHVLVHTLLVAGVLSLCAFLGSYMSPRDCTVLSVRYWLYSCFVPYSTHKSRAGALYESVTTCIYCNVRLGCITAGTSCHVGTVVPEEMMRLMGQQYACNLLY